MSVFISWSGARSKGVASALRTWLPNVLQNIEVWMSDADIEAGSRGINEVFAQLDRATFGIIVVTPGNRKASWLLFEAGALAKKLSEKSRVCPYLLALKTTDIESPLSEFQAVIAEKDGTFRLVKSINGSLPLPLTEVILKRTFGRWWPDLEKVIRPQIQKLQTSSSREASESELLKEILGSVRDISRRLDDEKKAPPLDAIAVARQIALFKSSQSSFDDSNQQVIPYPLPPSQKVSSPESPHVPEVKKKAKSKRSPQRSS